MTRLPSLMKTTHQCKAVSQNITTSKKKTKDNQHLKAVSDVQ